MVQVASSGVWGLVASLSGVHHLATHPLDLVFDMHVYMLVG
jgi:hypothetical protein